MPICAASGRVARRARSVFTARPHAPDELFFGRSVLRVPRRDRRGSPRRRRRRRRLRRRRRRRGRPIAPPHPSPPTEGGGDAAAAAAAAAAAVSEQNRERARSWALQLVRRAGAVWLRPRGEDDGDAAAADARRADRKCRHRRGLIKARPPTSRAAPSRSTASSATHAAARPSRVAATVSETPRRARGPRAPAGARSGAARLDRERLRDARRPVQRRSSARCGFAGTDRRRRCVRRRSSW